MKTRLKYIDFIFVHSSVLEKCYFMVVVIVVVVIVVVVIVVVVVVVVVVLFVVIVGTVAVATLISELFNIREHTSICPSVHLSMLQKSYWHDR